MTFKP